MEIRHSVMRFASNMEEILRTHDESKGRNGWVNMEPKKLLELMMGEVLELSDAMFDPKTDNQKIINECAGIANFSMMIADIMRSKEKDNG